MVPKSTTSLLCLDNLKSKRGSVNSWETKLINISSAQNFLDDFSKKHGDVPEGKCITSDTEEKLATILDNVNGQKNNMFQWSLM